MSPKAVEDWSSGFVEGLGSRGLVIVRTVG